MARNTIRLTESQLHRVIKESVKRVLRKGDYSYPQTEEEMAFEDFLHQNFTKIDPTKCAKVGVNYKLLQKYNWCLRHCYMDSQRTYNSPEPLKDKLRQQFMDNYMQRQREMGNQYDDDDFEY